VIKSFKGENRWLSNFWPVSVKLDDGEEIYPSVEHAYQAAKTTNPLMRRTIQHIATPGGAKKAAQLIARRPDWQDISIRVMERLLRQKFQHEALAKMLLATGDQELIEGNNWGDEFWGQVDGKGENNLGKLLMKIRDELKTLTSTFKAV
jgi:N-glycosidase YbiA